MSLPSAFKIQHPVTKEDFEKYYQLRYEALRKPWGQPAGSETDPDDHKSIHAIVIYKDQAVAVCRLQFNDSTQGQIRYMGVDENYRGYGVGAAILQWLENIAKKKGASHIILHARENAVGFYEKQGYKQLAKSYLLFGKIQHFLMEKKIV